MSWRPIGATLVGLLTAATAAVLLWRMTQLERQLARLSDQVAALEKAVQASRDAHPRAYLVPGRSSTLSTEDVQRIAAAVRAPPRDSEAPEQDREAATEPDSAPPSPIEQAAVERASRVVDAALRQHRLTRDEVVEIRTELAALRSPQAAEGLRARIASAINRNELVPEERPFLMP